MQEPVEAGNSAGESPENKKGGWTPDRYQQWLSGLKTKRTPRRKPQDFFEIEHTGPLNYLIKGGGEEFWADGLDALDVLEAKMVVSPRKSPFIEGAGMSIPAFIRESMIEEVREEFRRIRRILGDEGNPLKRLRVITNTQDARPFFEGLMREYGIAGEVVVK